MQDALTQCECLVMKCVWDSGKDVSLVEIMRVLEDRYNKEWKRQTVSTFLLHLIQKGYLSSYRVGRVFYYHPEMDIQEFRKQITKNFVDFWFAGSLEDLKERYMAD